MLKREKYDLESYLYRIESIVLSIKGVSLFARLTLIKYFWKGILYYLNNLLNISTECNNILFTNIMPFIHSLPIVKMLGYSVEHFWIIYE